MTPPPLAFARLALLRRGMRHAKRLGRQQAEYPDFKALYRAAGVLEEHVFVA
jgi:hypothetical protein